MSGRAQASARAQIAVLVRSPLWRVPFLRPAARARRAALAALAACGSEDARGCAVTLFLSEDREMRALNDRWRGRDRPTNVLAFPSGARAPGGRLMLGDVVLAFETIEREATSARTPLADHLSHLVVHGVLHLMGYDHAKPAEARAMEAEEVRVLAGLGIADPYAARPPARRPERR